MKAKYLLGLLLITSLCSCQDLLVEEPKSVMAPDQFFNSAEEAEAAVNGVYSNMYNWMSAWGRDWGYVSTWGTDIATPSRYISAPIRDYTLSKASPGPAGSYWRELYRGIMDANMVIHRVEASGIDDETKARIVGEGKFLRAFYYYQLTLLFGDVPLWLEELDIEEVSTLSRTPVEEVRAQIVADLEDAEGALPGSYSRDGVARATKWAAKALLVKVYLWQENWGEARATAAEIIQDSPHRLLDNYADIFDPDNESNSEIIFKLEYLQDVRSTPAPMRFEPRSIDEPEVPGYRFDGYGLVTSAPEFIETFDPEDKRLPLYNLQELEGVRLNSIYMPKWIQWDAPRGNTGQDFFVFRYADVLLMHAEAENELNGPTTEAFNSINRVRARAGLNPLSGLSANELGQAIMDERKWELAAEGHRRWDLVRWGKLVEAVRSMEMSNPEAAQNIREHHRLLPIPPDEIAQNPNLTQNPGY